LPVLCSDFPLWKDIIEGNKCGVCVDPESPAAIAEGIKKIAGNVDSMKQMGQNAHEAIIHKYNWEKESKKLIDLYHNLN
jgi:glycosyltransferase involved in cell wall biosynthesis